jgi:hypothetical protein
VKKFLFIVTVLSISTCSYVNAQATDFDTLNFDIADSIAALYSGHDLENPELLAQTLTKDLHTDVEKFRAIFRWVSNNIAYDVDSYHELHKKKQKFRYKREKLIKWQKKFHVKLYKRVFEKNLALCSGYSMLLERMAKAVGLQCETVEGYARNYQDRIGPLSLNHAWNVVHFGSKWYLVDVTWASGYVSNKITYFTKRFNEDYFLTDPFYFLAGHYPEKESWALLYDKPTLKEFQRSPIKWDGFIRYKINQVYPTAGLLKVKMNTPVDFSFTSNHSKVPKEVTIEIHGHKYASDATYDLKKSVEGHLFFKHSFTKKGHYRVMIFLGRRLAFVYEATVS